MRVRWCKGWIEFCLSVKHTDKIENPALVRTADSLPVCWEGHSALTQGLPFCLATVQELPQDHREWPAAQAALFQPVERGGTVLGMS